MTPLAESGLKLSAPLERGNNLISTLMHQILRSIPATRDPAGYKFSEHFSCVIWTLLAALARASSVNNVMSREARPSR